jgi:hypothetical protein
MIGRGSRYECNQIEDRHRKVANRVTGLKLASKQVEIAAISCFQLLHACKAHSRAKYRRE